MSGRHRAYHNCALVVQVFFQPLVLTSLGVDVIHRYTKANAHVLICVQIYTTYLRNRKMKSEVTTDLHHTECILLFRRHLFGATAPGCLSSGRLFCISYMHSEYTTELLFK